jgi:hypothetical protein
MTSFQKTSSEVVHLHDAYVMNPSHVCEQCPELLKKGHVTSCATCDPCRRRNGWKSLYEQFLTVDQLAVECLKGTTLFDEFLSLPEGCYPMLQFGGKRFVAIRGYERPVEYRSVLNEICIVRIHGHADVIACPIPCLRTDPFPRSWSRWMPEISCTVHEPKGSSVKRGNTENGDDTFTWTTTWRSRDPRISDESEMVTEVLFQRM